MCLIWKKDNIKKGNLGVTYAITDELYIHLKLRPKAMGKLNYTSTKIKTDKNRKQLMREASTIPA